MMLLKKGALKYRECIQIAPIQANKFENIYKDVFFYVNIYKNLISHIKSEKQSTLFHRYHQIQLENWHIIIL